MSVRDLSADICFFPWILTLPFVFILFVETKFQGVALDVLELTMSTLFRGLPASYQVLRY